MTIYNPKSDLIDAPEQDAMELVEEISYQVERFGMDCADNFRATPESNGFEEHNRKVSCCGNWEGKHTCQSGITYYIGCNYGH